MFVKRHCFSSFSRPRFSLSKEKRTAAEATAR
jgi:hypothetical protein